MAGVQDILNYLRHKGVFGTDKTPNFRAQRHGNKCFTSYPRKLTKSVIGEATNGHQSGKQFSSRSGPTFCKGLIWI